MWFGGHWPSVSLSVPSPPICLLWGWDSENHIPDLARWLSDGSSPSRQRLGGRNGEGTSFLLLEALVCVVLELRLVPASRFLQHLRFLVPSPMYQQQWGSAPSSRMSFDAVDWCLDCLQSLSQVGGLQLEFVIPQLSTAMGPPPIPLSGWPGVPLGPLGSWSISRRHPQCIVTWGQNTVLWHHWVLSLPEADPFCMQTTEASVSRASREKLVRFQQGPGGDSTAPHTQPFPLNPFTQKP